VGVGAILRLRPDGSGLRVFAEPLRHDCGLAFDRDWNLFTNDNDHPLAGHEAVKAEPARLYRELADAA
jgi:hypothetical protein